MDLGHSPRGGADLVAVPVKRLDADSAPQFRAAVLSLDLGTGPLVADLSAVEFIDSIGIGALLGCMRRQHEKGTTMRLCSLQPTVATIIKILKLDRVFEIYDTPNEALAV